MRSGTKASSAAGNEQSPRLVRLTKPTELPSNDEQAQAWQKANRQWWEATPMRYDWKKPIPAAEMTVDFFEEIDTRFFADAETFLPSQQLPFDRLIPFDRLRDNDVLEIGVGMGSHAALLAKHARSFTGIDLTDAAVKGTSQRLRLAGVEDTSVVQMDGERLAFADASFDFVWSWGVIHHSSNTRRVLEEIHRVLRPNGTAITMVYHRNIWSYWTMLGLLSGLARGDLLRTRSLTAAAGRASDGALARYYTGREWRALVSDLFQVDELTVYGSKTHLVPLPPGRIKNAALSAIPDGVGRLLTTRMGLGLFLVAVMHRRP